MTDFVSGIELNAAFYDEVVRPVMAPWTHAAARIGTGSDVLGFDDHRSTDHGWGRSVTVFVENDDAVRAARDAIEHVGHVEHVEVTTLSSWLDARLGFDPSTRDLETVDWLLTPQQTILEITRGAVYADDTGALARVRERLAWYPDDVWVWLIACQWRRVEQEEPFVGRTAEVGDALGSRIVAARVGRELMRLWFLFNRTHWPYTKWFGSAFARLPDSGPLGDALDAALRADNYEAREAGLAAASELVARRHNELAITEEIDPTVRHFYDRPFRVLMSERIVDACLRAPALVGSPLRALPLVGSVDQVADSTDVLSYGPRTRSMRALYETG